MKSTKFCSKSMEPHNKGMQTDQNVRYALILTADAGRYTAQRY